MLAEEPLKRFIVFGMYQYYPAGGMDDAVFSSDNPEDAYEWVQNDDDSDYHHVFDCVERRVLYPPFPKIAETEG